MPLYPESADNVFIIEGEDVNNPICSMRFDDEFERVNAEGFVYQEVYREFTEADIFKLAVQVDNTTFYALVSINPPVWQNIQSASPHSIADHTDVLFQRPLQNGDILMWSSQEGKLVLSTEGTFPPIINTVTANGVDVTVNGEDVVVTT